MELIPINCVDRVKLIVTRFEPFKGWYVQNGISGALLSLLGIGFFLFEVSNSSNIGAEGMNHAYTYYDFIAYLILVSVVIYWYIISSISGKFHDIVSPRERD